MKLFTLCAGLIGVVALAFQSQATVNADFASNYSEGWTNGANGGAGFGPWSIETVPGSGEATNGIWDSAAASLEMGSAFGFGAWGSGASIRLTRAFTQALTNGNVFALDLGLNYDAGAGGNKGFVLRAADNRAIVTVNQSDSDVITINGATALTNSGTTTMHWTITQISGTQVKIYATGRAGSEVTTIIVTNAAASFVANVQFYATNLTLDADAVLRGVYFDNLILSQAGAASTSFTYTVENSLTTITGVAASVTGDLLIPATLGGYPVVAIDRSAFKDRTNITSITFQSDTVTNIGPTAFQGCTQLALAVLPSALKVIPDGLFSGCSSLVSVTIPASVTNIGNMAFADCRRLPSLALPGGLKVLGQSAFLNCRHLAAISLTTNPASIPGQTFYECRSLASVDFPAGVTSIGYSAFYDCLSLSSLAPPSSLSVLAADAFNGCSGLAVVTFNGTLTSIGDRAFYGCASLGSVYFQGGVGNLGSTVFGCDPALTELYFTGSQPAVTGSGNDLFAASSVPSVNCLSLSGWSSQLGGAPVAAWLPLMGEASIQNHAFTFAVGWANNQAVRVQTSTNLAEEGWTDWTTGTVVNGVCTFADPGYSSMRQRFYRVLGRP